MDKEKDPGTWKDEQEVQEEDGGEPTVILSAEDVVDVTEDKEKSDLIESDGDGEQDASEMEEIPVVLAEEEFLEDGAEEFVSVTEPMGESQEFGGATEPMGESQEFGGATEPMGESQEFGGATEPMSESQEFGGAIEPKTVGDLKDFSNDQTDAVEEVGLLTTHPDAPEVEGEVSDHVKAEGESLEDLTEELEELIEASEEEGEEVFSTEEERLLQDEPKQRKHSRSWILVGGSVAAAIIAACVLWPKWKPYVSFAKGVVGEYFSNQSIAYGNSAKSEVNKTGKSGEGLSSGLIKNPVENGPILQKKVAKKEPQGANGESNKKILSVSISEKDYCQTLVTVIDLSLGKKNMRDSEGY